MKALDSMRIMLRTRTATCMWLRELQDIDIKSDVENAEREDSDAN